MAPEARSIYHRRQQPHQRREEFSPPPSGPLPAPWVRAAYTSTLPGQGRTGPPLPADRGSQMPWEVHVSPSTPAGAAVPPAAPPSRRWPTTAIPPAGYRRASGSRRPPAPRPPWWAAAAATPCSAPPGGTARRRQVPSVPRAMRPGRSDAQGRGRIAQTQQIGGHVGRHRRQRSPGPGWPGAEATAEQGRSSAASFSERPQRDMISMTPPTGTAPRPWRCIAALPPRPLQSRRAHGVHGAVPCGKNQRHHRHPRPDPGHCHMHSPLPAHAYDRENT